MRFFSVAIGIMFGFIFILFIFIFLQDIVSALSGIKGGIGYDFPGQEKWNAYFDSIFYTIFLGLPTLLGLTYYYLAKYFLLRDKKKLIVFLMINLGFLVLLALSFFFWHDKPYAAYIAMLLPLFSMIFLGATAYFLAKHSSSMRS